MKLKLTLIVVGLTLLTGCKTPFEETRTGVTVKGADSIQILCLENVQYYFYYKGYRGAMSPVIDSETLTFKNCK